MGNNNTSTAVGTEPAREVNSVDPRDTAHRTSAAPAPSTQSDIPVPSLQPDMTLTRNPDSSSRSDQNSGSENTDGGGFFGAFRRILGHRD